MGRMTNKKVPLADAVRSKGFTPGKQDIDALLDMLDTDDDKKARTVESALLKTGPASAVRILERLNVAVRPARGHIVRVLGKIARAGNRPELAHRLISLLHDADLKSRKNAILALGGISTPEAQEALLDLWKEELRPEHRRAVAAALGKIGGTRALEALSAFRTEEPELSTILAKSRMMIGRTLTRSELSGIDGDVVTGSPSPLLLRCRDGLETILAQEFDESWHPSVIAPGVVRVTLSRPLKDIFRARTFISAAFMLPDVSGETDDAVVRSLCGGAAQRIFRTWTRGSVRYRIEWADAGHRRSAVWSCARRISEKCPDLVNDPTDSVWEAVVRRTKKGVKIELVPKKLQDERFRYRGTDVPAASHPQLSAALARVAGVRPDDTVWDPFVGSGTELIERAMAGPYRRLYGTDISDEALRAARANLESANVRDAVLTKGDCIQTSPPSVTLIITNPPMGRRVERGSMKWTLDRFLEHAAKMLTPGGRLVWVSPLPKVHATSAQRLGLKTAFTQNVDMGGFTGQIQKFVKL